MLKKHTPYIFLLIAVMLLFSATQPALALEVNYPQIGSFGISDNSNLLQYIEYFFAFAIAISGIIAVITLVISGLQILVFAGSPEKITEAKDGLWASILGIALLFASFIIMTTINPQLVNLSTQQLPMSTPSGVLLDFVYQTAPGGNGFGQVTRTQNPAPQSNENIQQPPDIQWTPPPPSSQVPITLFGQNAMIRIRYNCSPPTNGKDGPRLMVRRYSKPYFEIVRGGNESGVDENIRTYFLKCNANANNWIQLSVGESYKWDFEKPGVYFYLTRTCDETPLGAGWPTDSSYTSVGSDAYTENSIIKPFDCEVINGGGGDEEDEDVATETCRPREGVSHTPACIRLINSEQDQYGTILNQEESAQGECSYPILNKDVPTGSALIKEFTHQISAFDGDGYEYLPNSRFAYVFKHVPAPDTTQVKFESSNLYTEVKRNDFDANFNRRLYKLPTQYAGNLNNWLEERPEGDGQRLDPNVAPGAQECRNPAKPCLKYTRNLGAGPGGFRIILYGGNEVDFSDDACQVYTCDENNFGEFVSNNNRWIFNSNRKPYNMYIIPMPTKTCDQS